MDADYPQETVSPHEIYRLERALFDERCRARQRASDAATSSPDTHTPARSDVARDAIRAALQTESGRAAIGLIRRHGSRERVPAWRLIEAMRALLDLAGAHESAMRAHLVGLPGVSTGWLSETTKLAKVLTQDVLELAGVSGPEHRDRLLSLGRDAVRAIRGRRQERRGGELPTHELADRLQDAIHRRGRERRGDRGPSRPKGLDVHADATTALSIILESMTDREVRRVRDRVPAHVRRMMDNVRSSG